MADDNKKGLVTPPRSPRRATAQGDNPPSQVFGDSLTGSKVIKAELRRIYPNPYQPRIDFPEAEIQELAESINTHGLMQPILVRKKTDGVGYEIYAGERRFRAHQLLDKEFIDAIIVEISDTQMATGAIIENIQREGLNPLEIALGIERLKSRLEDAGETIIFDDIAQMLGKSKGYISKIMSLLKLSKDVLDVVSKNQYKVLAVLNKLNDIEENKQLEKLTYIMENSLSRDEAISYLSASNTAEQGRAGFTIKKDKKGKKFQISIDISNISKSEKRKAVEELTEILEKLNSN